RARRTAGRLRVGSDVRVRSRPGPFSNASGRTEASRLSEGRNRISVSAPIENSVQATRLRAASARQARLPLSLKKTLSAFSEDALSAASFVHIAWLLRSPPAAISLVFAPPSWPRDEQ